jgi:peptidoglycan/xylan/chitin deacetylase (PgdA/CDA1 family)
MKKLALVLLLVLTGCMSSPKSEITNWPNGYKAAVCPTFEAETAGVEEFRILTRALGTTNATFFIVAGYYQDDPRALYLIRDYEIASLDWNQKEWREYYDSEGFQEDSIRRAQEWFRKIGYNPAGFRAPLLLSNRETIKALEVHGYKYDSSQYFGFLPYTINGVVEIPLSLNFDPLWNNASREYSLLPVHLVFQKTYDEGGLFTFTSHVSKASQNIEDLTRLLEFIKSRKSVWIASCNEIADWWLKRENLELKSEMTLITVKNNNKEKVEGITIKVSPKKEVIGAVSTWEEGDSTYAILPPINPGEEVDLQIVTNPSFLERLFWWV